jgi:ribonucleotide monophosphatase NagD (HAD superfamily)
VGTPAVLERMKKARPAVDKFVFLSNIPEKDKRAAFYKLNDIYKSQFNQVKINDSIATLHYLLKQLAPYSKIVHKGNTDIDAIANTCRMYGLPLPELNTRNLNHYSHKFVGLYGVEHDKKLGTLQELFASHDEELRHIRDTMIVGSEKYMTSIYGEGLELKAHNPLVDCVYALILDIAVAKYLSD